MKKITTLLSVALLTMSSAGFAQTWTENFNNGIPATWTLYNVDNLTPNTNVAYVNKAWVSRIKTDAKGQPVTGDSVATSTSWYTPAGVSNDWLVSPSFNVTSANMILRWEAKGSSSSYADGYEVRISTTGNAVADFSTVAYSTAAENTDKFINRYINLSAYNGQSIRIAFRNNSNDKELLFIDNVRVYVPVSADLNVTDVTPITGSPTDYEVTGGALSLGGTVFNNGINPVTSFIVKYQQGANAPVSNTVSGVNIAPFSSGDFSCSNKYTMPGVLGNYPIKMWVELPGDVDNTNDSINTSVTAVSFKPTKKILVEEATGTWCGWCPRGAVYMDSLAHTYSSAFTLVAVHNNDPMTVTAYDAFMGTALTAFKTGYPSVYVDRREMLDPSELLDVYNNEKDYFGFATMTVADMNAPGFGLSVKVSVKPALDLTGDYRLALLLTEDEVQGNSSDTKWDQHNYYSSTQANLPLVGAGHNWQTSGSTIAGEDMRYQFVGRAILPSAAGAPGSLPATMTAGTTYDYTFNTTVPQPYFRQNMHVSALLIRNADGAVLNSAEMTMPLGISNIAAGVQRMNVYPNPATDITHIAFNLDEKANVQVHVINAIGQVVNTIAEQHYEKGAQQISINTANLPAGIYTIKLQTEKGSLTQQLAIAK